MSWKNIKISGDVVNVDFQNKKRLQQEAAPPIPRSESPVMPITHLYEDTDEFDPCKNCGETEFTVVNHMFVSCNNCREYHMYDTLPTRPNR